MTDRAHCEPASRLSAVRPFLVMEVLERAKELEAQGRSIVHLEVGEPDFDTPPAVCHAAVEAIASGRTHYTHSLGDPELREAIAEHYARTYQVHVDPECIVVTAGSSLAMLYAFAALVNPGDEVIAATPHYPCYPNFVGFCGGRLVEAPTDPSDGYRLDPDVVKRMVTSRTKAILINSPSNPTGAVLERDRLQAITSIGLPVISDEVYHGLAYDVDAPSILEACPEAVVLNGFSKRYAMTGWRLGWLIAPRQTVRAVQTLQQSFLISAGDFVQAAGVAALRDADGQMRAMRGAYLGRRELIVRLFRELGFVIPVMPQGAFYVFADVSAFTQDSYGFAFEMLECAGVGVAPGIDFGECGRRAVRLSYATSEEGIREAAGRIREWLPCRC